MWGEKEPCTLWWECKLVQPLWKSLWRVLKLKIELPYDPAVSLDIYPKEGESEYSRET
jgi:hypothetical protein